MFPNLIYVMRLRVLLQYQLASRVGITESRFSRCLTGRLQFTPAERTRIAEALGSLDQAWLFAQPVPPRAVHVGSIPIMATQS